jgi:hypothetical protein
MLISTEMTSYDGQGYGKSMSWHYIAVNAAKKNGESCEHVNHDTIRINIQPQETPDQLVKLKVTCSMCNKDLEKTSEKVTRKFLKFYGK